MYLFRIHIRPDSDPQVAFDYCLKHGVLGVGWKTESGTPTKDWDTYFEEASPLHGALQQCAYIRKWVTAGDLVWCRDPHGRYYLARVTSGWEYWTTPESEEQGIDIGNIFRCTFKPVEIEMVPGKVVASFRAPKSMQEVGGPKALEYSKFLWNKLSGEEVYSINRELCSDIFMFLGADETEDLVFLYLQKRGWYVVPNSRRADTMAFEYTVVDPQTGEIALTQVKTGGTELNRDDYRIYGKRIFLFQSNEIYLGDEDSRIECITRHELLRFLDESKHWLPAAIRFKYELAGGFSS